MSTFLVILILVLIIVAIIFFSKKESNKKGHEIYSGDLNDNEEYRQFKVNVAGISFPNTDGTSRIKIALSCRPGQNLLLVREPDNKHDSDAVKILTEQGQQIGYIDSWNAKDLQATLKGTSRKFSHAEAQFLESGTTYSEDGKKITYCSITIRKYYKNSEQEKKKPSM